MAYQSPFRLMRLTEVLDLTGLSRATLYRKISAGTFPPQHKLAERCCGWRVGEVEFWLRNPVSFTLADLERTSANNIKSAKDLTVARIVVVESYTEYTALPAAQRRSNDIVIVRGA